MEQGLKVGECGHCGGDKFKIYRNLKEQTLNRLIFECTDCQNTTELIITIPELSIKWHGNSEGILHFSDYE